MPLPDKSMTFTLEKVGAPEFSVTVIRIAGMPYSEMIEHLKISDVDRKMYGEEAPVINHFRGLIQHWNVEDHTGKIPLPSENDEWFKRLCTQFTNFITETILEDVANPEQLKVPLVQKEETS